MSSERRGTQLRKELVDALLQCIKDFRSKTEHEKDRYLYGLVKARMRSDLRRIISGTK